MMARLASWSALFALSMLAPAAVAEQRTSVWVEDVRLEPEEQVETAFTYEFQTPDLKAIEEGTDLLSFRLNAGVAKALELAPVIRLRQRGNEALRLDELGGEGRLRVIGDAEAPHLIVYARYFNDLGENRDHRISAGTAGRYDLSRLLLGADLRASGGFGGLAEDSIEIWLGGMIGYSLLPDRKLTAGLETFVIVPASGPRISDPTFGEAGQSVSYYYGPVFSLRAGPIWTAASLVTGYPVSEPASHLLFRWMVGVGH